MVLPSGDVKLLDFGLAKLTTIDADLTKIGISLGSTTPYKVLGITLPRVFIGVRVGDGLRGVRLRFGRL